MATVRHPSAPSPSDPDGATPTYPIGSVDSALRLLLLIGERGQLRVAEASRELDVARSTAHRLLQMLQYHRFARQDPESKAYVAGAALLNLGLQAVRSLDIRTVSRPYLEALVAETQETAHLLAAQGTEMSCLDSLESPKAVRVGSRVGMVLPSFASASGRAVLATLPPARVRELYPSRLPKAGPDTIATRAELERELELARERGYAVQRGQMEADVSAISAAIRDAAGQASFAITIAVPTARLRDEDVPRLGAAAVRCADEIAAALPL